MSGEKHFCSKILLFGEYSIIQNSMALSTPFSLFKGGLTFRAQGSRPETGRRKRKEEKSLGPCGELQAFAHYLQKLVKEEKDLLSFDLNSFFFDVGQGLFFDSSIPLGFGVGSSGALVAAVFDRYSKHQENAQENSQGNELNAMSAKMKEEILWLRKIFAKMESHFHGKSSGIDPLISYLNRPLLIRSQEDLDIVGPPQLGEGKGAIFLLNTKRPRRTGPLVQLFLEKCKDPSFSQLCQKEFIPITNHCIDYFLKGEIDNLWKTFMKLSEFQLKHFEPMIPEPFQGIWQKGLQSQDYILKLCGAGGGGFLLGMTADFEKTCAQLDPYQLRLVFPLSY